MPLQSPPRKVSETEYMLRLLLSVDTLESLTPAQLWTFAAEQELVDYVTMRLCLHKLLAAGELEMGEGALTDQLLLTDRGREALALFGDRLPTDIRTRIAQAAPDFRTRIARSRQVQAVYDLASPNDYRLNLSVQEGDLPTLFIRMATTNRTLASKVLRRFEAHAAEVTTYFYELAAHSTQAAPAGALVSTLPDCITVHSTTEVTATVALPGKKAHFTVDLLLPSQAAARQYVLTLADSTQNETVTNHLLTLLSSPVRSEKKDKV